MLKNQQTRKPLLALPGQAKAATAHAINRCKLQIDNLSSRSKPNWHNPNPFHTLRTIDQVSNELCKIIDSAALAYGQFAGGPTAISEGMSEEEKQDVQNRLELQEALATCIDHVGAYFNQLNQDRDLLTLLSYLQCRHSYLSQLDFEDMMLLENLLRQLKTEQRQRKNFEIYNRLKQQQALLQRKFVEYTRQARPQVSLTAKQLKSLPNRAFLTKYKDQFEDDATKEDVVKELLLDNVAELEVLKLSADPAVRAQFFEQFCRSCAEKNSPVILQLCRDRQQLAQLQGDTQTYWAIQAKKNLIQIGDLKGKIRRIREIVKEQSMKDLEIIRQIAGTREPIRYWDMAFLKERVKQAVLAGEKRNIQMLTCFSLENVLSGLLLLLNEKFGCVCKIKTVILDAKTGELLDERFDKTFSKFRLEHINDKEYHDQVVYFVIEIENAGTIIMDMFRRSGKLNKY